LGDLQNKELEKEIESLEKIASIVNKPTEFRTLKCEGAFKDVVNSRYGFVYKPPDYLELVPKEELDDDAVRRRTPMSLNLLMETASDEIPEGFDLNRRIALAKKLAQSLLVLHSAGWVHKKYDTLACASVPESTSKLTNYPASLPKQ
jgi:hypothetical protein